MIDSCSGSDTQLMEDVEVLISQSDLNTDMKYVLI